MLSLNQISQKLIDFFSSHAQVSQVLYEDDFEFNAQRELNYPVAVIEFLDASINDKQLNYNFKIVIGDKASSDVLIQNEVISDAILIAEDLYAYLQDGEGWVFKKSSSIQKFVEDTGDNISGIVFTTTISVIRSQNTCQTPQKTT